MFKKKNLILVLVYVSVHITTYAQNNTALDNFLVTFNNILKENDIPTVKNIDDDLSKYEDDFEYLKALKNDFKPHERQKEDCSTCYAFLIPKSSLTGYRCKTGNCKDKDGILTIKKNEIYYLGNFSNSLAHGSGVLYFVNKGFLKGNFYKGTISKVEFVGTQGNSAVLESSSGMLATATQFYTKKYDAYYTGSINSNLEMTVNNYNNKLISTYYDLTLRQNTSNQITSFFGLMKSPNGNIIEGNFSPDLKFADGDIKVKTPNGDVMTSTVYNGNIERYNVKILNGEDYYVGEVDENYKPHGRGTMKKNGKVITTDRFEHGTPVYANKSKSNSFQPHKTNESISARSELMANLKQQCSREWSKYIYCRTPKQNFVTVNTFGKKTALLINLTNKPIKLKVKLHFITNTLSGFNPWEKITIPASKDLTSLESLGRKLFEIPYPYDDDTHEIEVKGSGVNDVFWIISK